MTNRATLSQGTVTTNIFVLAAWFGLAAGLLESSGLLLLQRLGWATWDMGLWAVAPEILWISSSGNSDKIEDNR